MSCRVLVRPSGRVIGSVGSTASPFSNGRGGPGGPATLAVLTISRRWLKDQRFVGPNCQLSGAQRSAGGGGKPVMVKTIDLSGIESSVGSGLRLRSPGVHPDTHHKTTSPVLRRCRSAHGR